MGEKLITASEVPKEVVFITGYTKNNVEYEFDSINDIYDWIRYCKKEGIALYDESGETSAYYAKTSGGSVYQLTSNFPSYSSLIDPDREIKEVKEKRVIVRKSIPFSAVPGSRYLVRSLKVSEKENGFFMFGTMCLSGDTEYTVSGGSVELTTGYFSYNTNQYSKANTLISKTGENSFRIYSSVRESNNKGPETILVGFNNVEPRKWYLVEIKGRIYTGGTSINMSAISFSVVNPLGYDTPYLETTMPNVYFNGRLHLNREAKIGKISGTHYCSRYDLKTFPNESSLRPKLLPRSRSKWKLYKQKYTKRAKKICTMGQTFFNYLYKNHCIFDAKFEGGELVLFRTEEISGGRKVDYPSSFTGGIYIEYRTPYSDYESFYLELQDSQECSIHYTANDLGVEQYHLDSGFIMFVYVENGGNDYFYGITEQKPNRYKKIGRIRPTKQRKTKAGTYYAYEIHRGIKSETPVVFICEDKFKLYSFAGNEYVDMGLTSGILWATKNVGAATPQQIGNRFAFGETRQKNQYTPQNYAYGTGHTYTKYDVDGRELLETDDDPARKNMWGKWRIPTVDEWDELLYSCTIERVQGGYRFTSDNNGNTLFFPDCGYVSGTTEDTSKTTMLTSSVYSGEVQIIRMKPGSGTPEIGFYEDESRYTGKACRGVIGHNHENWG